MGQIAHFQANAKSTLLDFVCPVAISDLDIDVFDDPGPNGFRKLRRFERSHDQRRRQARLLMVSVQDGPSGATRQEHLGLLVKSVKSRRISAYRASKQDAQVAMGRPWLPFHRGQW
jgi:hypothetical protein